MGREGHTRRASGSVYARARSRPGTYNTSSLAAPKLAMLPGHESIETQAMWIPSESKKQNIPNSCKSRGTSSPPRHTCSPARRSGTCSRPSCGFPTRTQKSKVGSFSPPQGADANQQWLSFSPFLANSDDPLASLSSDNRFTEMVKWLRWAALDGRSSAGPHRAKEARRGRTRDLLRWRRSSVVGCLDPAPLWMRQPSIGSLFWKAASRPPQSKPQSFCLVRPIVHAYKMAICRACACSIRS